MTTTSLTRSTSRGSSFELAYASPVISLGALRLMGVGTESLERHNSKRHRPRAFNDEEGKYGEDGRKRRSLGSSDDEGEITEDGFSNEDLRVGGPYLCSLPLLTIPILVAHPLHGLLQEKVSSGGTFSECIHAILRDKGVRLIASGPWDHPVTFCLRQSKYYPEDEPIPTILILATRFVVDDDWLQAARRIHSLLRQERVARISVEIADPQAFRQPSMSPVLDSDPIWKKWSSVLSDILRTVELRDIQLIGCYRRGRNEGKENPVTVLVIVNIDSQRKWRNTREIITKILDKWILPLVAVEIIKDRRSSLKDPVEPEAKTGFNTELLTGRAMAGGPIAHSSNDQGSGTLGGFIELQGPSTQKWTCFALTCFHVINPRDRDIDIRGQGRAFARRWRTEGLSMKYPETDDPKMSRQFLRTSHPSLRAKKEQIDDHQEGIDWYCDQPRYKRALEMVKNELFDMLKEAQKEAWREDDSDIRELKGKINRIENFFRTSDNILGFVRVASGLRLKNIHTLGNITYPTNLDWALVEVDLEKRTPSNKLEFKKLGTIISLQELSNLSESDMATQLQYQGYRSGYRQVRYNGLQVAEIEGSKATLEYTISGPKNHATLRGDSGSLLYTSHSKVVGMVIGGFDNTPIARFTRIDDLTKDIIEHTGAIGIRMWAN